MNETEITMPAPPLNLSPPRSPTLVTVAEI
jgi:hypothetical protein